MRQHLDLVGQLARSFGNSDFAPLEPKAIVEHAAANHDSGWFEVDLTMPLDPLSHLPRNLLMAPEGNTPVVGSGSAAIGEAFHPYSGLLISMHHTGLQQDRYGEGGGKVPVFAEMVSEARLFREATGEAATWGPGVRGVDDFLAFEAERQERLKEMLCRDPSTAPWVSQRALWTNYRALQFFDTLALYFCLASEDDRPPAGEPVEFQKVPLGPSGKCATVKVAHLSEGRYSISPFPFAESPLQVELAGTLVRPDSETHANTQELLTKGVEHVERFVLVRDD